MIIRDSKLSFAQVVLGGTLQLRWRGIGILMGLLGLMLSVGCGSSDVNQIEDLQAVSLFSQGDQLPRTMSYINSTQRYDQQEFQKNVTSGLNRWYGSFTESGEDVTWEAPSIIDTLPEPSQQSPFAKNFSSRSFVPADAHYIQEMSWLNSISERVRSTGNVSDFNVLIDLAKSRMTDEQRKEFAKSSDLLAFVLWVLNPELDPPVETNEGDDLAHLASSSQQMATALRLFDWSCRNVQLRTMEQWPTPKLTEAKATFDNAFGAIPTWPPAAGVKGPGYSQFPWQMLTYGRCDYLERANLFLNLLDQSGISGCMLAVPNEDTDDTTRPYEEWVVAVSIKDHLFLFDSELGLPFPGVQPGEIATLDDVLKNSELVSNLSLTVDESIDPIDYRIKHERLKDVFALIDAAPESLSKRLRAVEENLSGENRLKLTRNVDEEADQLKQNAALQSVRLWHVPFSIHQYRDITNQALARYASDQSVRGKLQWHFLEEGYIDVFASFRSAKNLYIRGRFETPRNDPRPNALTAFNRFTYSDEEIASFEQDTVLQRDLGIYKGAGQSFNEWSNQLLVMKEQMKTIRADAAFYLALSHYENGYPSTALNWLGRIDDFDTKARWLSAVDYQKARAYEATGQYDEAVKIYRKKGSPQRHGNVLRARLVSEVEDADDS